MKVRLSQLAGRRVLRTEFVEGEAEYPPIVGKPFIVFSDKALVEGDGRMVQTSLVTDVRGDGVFATQNGSLYQIEVLEGPFLLGVMVKGGKA